MSQPILLFVYLIQACSLNCALSLLPRDADIKVSAKSLKIYPLESMVPNDALATILNIACHSAAHSCLPVIGRAIYLRAQRQPLNGNDFESTLMMMMMKMKKMMMIATHSTHFGRPLHPHWGQHC